MALRENEGVQASSYLDKTLGHPVLGHLIPCTTSVLRGLGCALQGGPF